MQPSQMITKGKKTSVSNSSTMTSSALGQITVPIVHDMTQINAVSIFVWKQDSTRTMGKRVT